jgi:acetyl-CoA carboxylase biotin carboxylase subunit
LIEPQGPGVRVDSGIYRGWEVPIHYDPLLAKLVTFGADRAQAIARMRRAIGEYRILGIHSNLAFFGAVLSDPEFVAGRLSTNFIEEFMKRRPTPEAAPAALDAARIAAALAYADAAVNGTTPANHPDNSAWKLSGRAGNARPRRGWK